MHGQVVRKLESNAKVNSKVKVEVRVELGNENSTEETLLHSSRKYEIKIYSYKTFRHTFQPIVTAYYCLKYYLLIIR